MSFGLEVLADTLFFPQTLIFLYKEVPNRIHELSRVIESRCRMIRTTHDRITTLTRGNDIEKVNHELFETVVELVHESNEQARMVLD